MAADGRTSCSAAAQPARLRRLSRGQQRRRRSLAAWLTVALSMLCACGPAASSETFMRAMYAGKRAYNAGRYQDAAHAYERAVHLATRVKDRDEARFLQARMLQRRGQPRAAQAAYRTLVRQSPHGPRTARAVFEVALIEIDDGDGQRGYDLLRAAVVRYPDHGSARRGLKLLVARMAEREGEPAVRAFLSQQRERFRGTEAEQQAEYELAASLEREGLLARAREAFVQTARSHPYPYGNLTDDAWWRASKVDEELGHHERAIADLRAMLVPVEEDISGGRYERPRFPHAQMRIAKLYRDRLGDGAAARREFRRVHERHSESAIADDALWQELLLARRDGDQEDVCDVAALLNGSYPDSRYVRCLPQLCEEVEPPDGRGPCPPYLARELAEPRAAGDSK